MPLRDIGDVVAAMDARLVRLPPDRAAQRPFLETYRRTTLAVGRAIEDASFEDPDWVEQWDVVFADLYLTALDRDLAAGAADVAADVAGGVADGRGDVVASDREGDVSRDRRGGAVPRPWRLAFDAPASLPPLRHVLLGINAHINYDLPQALLAVIPDEDFDDPRVIARRARDHERIDAVLSSRVAAEDAELGAVSTVSLVDRVLQPLNRSSSRRFLREARRKVWHNTVELQRARVAGTQVYAVRLAELEVLSAARIADLLAPGPVLLRLAVAGFGVRLPPPLDESSH